MTLAQAKVLGVVGEQLSHEELRTLIRHKCRTREAGIYGFRHDIAYFRHLENAFAPIEEFPAELLVEIFVHLVESSGGVQALVRATHVCARWRKVALGAAKLWSTFSLDLDKLALARAFLRRSGNLPLSISLKSAQGSTHNAVDVVVPQASRLRSLRLTIGEDRNLRRLLARLKAPAPELEELVIEKFERNPRPFKLVDKPLFAGDMPALKSLTTCNVDLAIVLPSPSALVHLNITSNKMYMGKELLDLLDCCPLLETFTYAGSPGFLDNDIPFKRLVALPHLKSLSLDFASPMRTAALLSHLSIPHSTALLAKTTYDPGVPDERVYSMFPANASKQLKCLEGIKRLELHFAKKPLCRLRAFHDPDQSVDPAIELEIWQRPHSVNAFLRDWPFDVSQVQTLVITGLDPNRDEVGIWTAALEGMAELRCLRIIDLHATFVVNLMHQLICHTPGADPDDALRFHFCPKLAALEIYDAPPSSIDHMLLGLIVCIATNRAEFGMLEEIHLFNVAGMIQDVTLQRTVYQDGDIGIAMVS